MTVNIAQVATELARPIPEAPVSDQWQSWIDRAYRMIESRLGAEKYAALDPALLDDVVTTAVAEHARAWRETTATQYTVTVDDGTVSRRFDAGVGLFTIPDGLWVLLDPAATTGGAFTVTPYFEPDVPDVESWA